MKSPPMACDTHREFGGICHKDSLEDFGEIAQVEGVVALGWGWQELGGNCVINIDAG